MKDLEKISEIDYEQVASEIKAMVEADQDMRRKNISDSEYWDEELDDRNTTRMKEIVE